MYKDARDMSLEDIEAFFVKLPTKDLDNYVVKFWNMLDRGYPALLKMEVR